MSSSSKSEEGSESLVSRSQRKQADLVDLAQAKPLRADSRSTKNPNSEADDLGNSPSTSSRSHFSEQASEITSAPLIPARMVNEFVYCPRLAYLEWVQKEWEASVDTVQGKFVHRRVDRVSGQATKGDSDEGEPKVVRSVSLSSSELGVTAKIDLLELDDNRATPVEYKKSKRPHIKHNAWDPDRVQLCVQGLLLKDHGFECSHGVIYYAASRERVKVSFDDELVALTKHSIAELKILGKSNEMPPPLKDSPKCPRCSLVGICLPDETNLLRSVKYNLRPVSVKHTTAYPLYLTSQGAKVAKDGGELVVTIRNESREEESRVRIAEVSHLVVFGNVYITTPTIHTLLSAEIPICWFSYGGWFLGQTISNSSGNIEMRTAQFRRADDPETCLRLSGGLIEAKILNCRTLLMRNARDLESSSEFSDEIETMRKLARRARHANSLSELLGIEGHAAALYYNRFDSMLQNKDRVLTDRFSFETRNRRPPKDPINAMLSYGYALLVKQLVIALMTVGLDPYRGFMHQERFGRPSLALDLMEPFRPLIVDSTVLMVINNGEIKTGGFQITKFGVNMTESTRKKFIAAFERRLSQKIQHPQFHYQVEYRRIFEMQARFLGRYLLGELPEYPNIKAR